MARHSSGRLENVADSSWYRRARRVHVVVPMDLRVLAVLAAVIPLGCGGGGDGGEGEGEGEPPDPEGCADTDGDGYGLGRDCLGDDCDETDSAIHDGCGQSCDDDPQGTACPCSDEASVVACYTGAEGSSDLGQCKVGLRRCQEGAWSGCEGQVTPGDELCNLLDDDCDGAIDEEVTNECGTCDEDCKSLSIGRGGDDDWNVDEEGTPGLVVDPEGGLTLRTDSVLRPYIWIPNAGDGTVTKVNTRTLAEEGRYALGPGNRGAGATALGGISVNLDVDVVVSASLSGPRVTRVNLEDCRDTDADGVLSTSSGGDDVLDFEEDECVAWSTEIPTGQPGSLTTVAWEQRALLDGVEYYVWVGDALRARILELTSEGDLTGREADVDPVQVAGIAVDPNGDLWAGSHGTAGHLARVETDDLDVTLFNYNGQKYDCIAADADGKIWITGLESSAAMFDPSIEEFTDLAIDAWGISVDAEDYVWFGGLDGYVYRLDRDTLDTEQIDGGFGGGGGLFGGGFVYTAVDTDGMVWDMSSSSDAAQMFDPTSVDDGEARLELAIDTLSMPGACGDMTGTQLGYVAVPQGVYDHIFEGCDEDRGAAAWRTIEYEADLPEGSSLRIQARMADTVPALLAEDWFDVATAPADASPIDLAAAIEETGLPHQKYIELKLTLLPGRFDANPRLFSLGVLRACGVPIG